MPRSKLVQEALDEAEDWELKLPVSMIDVTFLLLIFFICTAKFKALEQRLDAKLPKDKGLILNDKRVDKVEEIRVKIALKDRNRPSSGARILVNNLSVEGLNDLTRKLADLHEMMPAIPVVIDGRQSVPFRWILGSVDACARAKITDVKFQAPPAEGGGGDDWWYE